MLPWAHEKINSTESPSMPLSPRELHFFPSCYSFTYQGGQMLSWGSLPVLRHQRWTDVKTLQSACWEAELIREPWFISQIFMHICTYSPMHIVLKEQLLQGQPPPQTDASRLLPSAHTFCPPPPVRCTKFQGTPSHPIHLDLPKNWAWSTKAPLPNL